MRTEVVDLGLGYPTRIAARDRGLGLYEHEVQVDVGDGFERLLSWNPKRADFETADAAFAMAVKIARGSAPPFFGPWLARRTSRLVAEARDAAERKRKREEYEAAAEKRLAYAEHGRRELARRSDEAAAAADARARLRTLDGEADR